MMNGMYGIKYYALSGLAIRPGSNKVGFTHFLSYDTLSGFAFLQHTPTAYPPLK